MLIDARRQPEGEVFDAVAERREKYASPKHALRPVAPDWTEAYISNMENGVRPYDSQPSCASLSRSIAKRSPRSVSVFDKTDLASDAS